MKFPPSLSLQSQIAVCVFALCLPSYSGAASLSLPGLPNFQKVNEQVYRGAQPTDRGFSSLATLGIKTIVDLRFTGEHSQADEQKLVEGSGMHYVSVPMKGMSAPAAESIAKVLALLQDAAAVPVFVHCQRGADRTGAVIACYRIQHDGWDTRKALEEANGYGMSWFQRALRDYVKHFQHPETSVLQ